MCSFKLPLICVVFGLVLGCQNTPCREIENQKNKNANTETPLKAGSEGSAVESSSSTGAGALKVRVYKPDGSLQCGMGKKVSLESMEKELKGIKVLSRSNRNDGLMRIQVCGAPTGNANVYEIHRDDLEKALKKGFKEWTFD